jgi:hypothetical protein
MKLNKKSFKKINGWKILSDKKKKIKWERDNLIKVKWKKFEVQYLASKILKDEIKKKYIIKKS